MDFRELVKDLVQKFKIRIELKQIGARQETRITKGIAVCGRMVCCAGISAKFGKSYRQNGERTEHVAQSGKNFRIVRPV